VGLRQPPRFAGAVRRDTRCARRGPALPRHLHARVRRGWDWPLYRADYLQDAGSYGLEPRRCEDACYAALRARGGAWKFYENEPHALAAVDQPDPLYDAPGGWRARWALRQQLIAVEALADDL
jgi:hypothetical protein